MISDQGGRRMWMFVTVWSLLLAVWPLGFSM